MSKILLAISVNWQVDERIDAIADYAKRMKSAVLAVHCVYGSDSQPLEVSPGERMLELVSERLKAQAVAVESLLLFSDDVAAAMLQTAQEKGVTLIMLGLSTKGMLQRLIEGNIPQEIIKNTHFPVLMLPPDWKGEI